MEILDLSDPEFTYDADDPDGFRSGMFRMGPRLGASATGASVYEIPPGQALCPYHYEYGEEEWVLVLDGTATVRTPAGSEPLRPRQLAFFPPGPEGAHQIRNEGREPLRVLMWSSIVHPGVTVYPDSDKIGVWPAPGSDDAMLVPRSARVDYFFGET